MEIEFDRLVKRFQDYISFNTQSSEDNEACPSTPGQFVLAKHIVEELQNIGLSEVRIDAHGYVMATLPANGCPEAPFQPNKEGDQPFCCFERAHSQLCRMWAPGEFNHSADSAGKTSCG